MDVIQTFPGDTTYQRHVFAFLIEFGGVATLSADGRSVSVVSSTTPFLRLELSGSFSGTDLSSLQGTLTGLRILEVEIDDATEWAAVDFSSDYAVEALITAARVDFETFFAALAPPLGASTFVGSGRGDMAMGFDASDDDVALGAGDDLYFATSGTDSVDGGPGADTVYFSGGGSGGAVWTVGAGPARYGDGTELAIVAVENARGTDAGDRLTGDGGSTVFHGGDGRDVLIGKGGDDSLYGQRGGDVLRGGGGDDRLEGNGRSDRLFGGGGADLILAGTGHDVIRGQDGADVLEANGGDDTMFGGAGNDSLFGGFGDNLMEGGPGADLFRIAAARGNQTDTILDFALGEDRLDLGGRTASLSVADGDTRIDYEAAGDRTGIVILVGVEATEIDLLLG